MITLSHHQRLLWERLEPLRARWPMEQEFLVAEYNIDIYIPALRIAIEVDGHHHRLDRSQRYRDTRRDEAMRRIGVMTVRVPNHEVVGDVGSLIQRLEQICEKREATPLAKRGQRLPGPPLSV